MRGAAVSILIVIFGTACTPSTAAPRRWGTDTQFCVDACIKKSLEREDAKDYCKSYYFGEKCCAWNGESGENNNVSSVHGGQYGVCGS